MKKRKSAQNYTCGFSSPRATRSRNCVILGWARSPSVALPDEFGDKDIYLLSAARHRFDDDTCVRALPNLGNVIAETGARIALMEMAVLESCSDLASASFDMQMVSGTRGKERARAEWESLFDRCGSSLEAVVSLRSIEHIHIL